MKTDVERREYLRRFSAGLGLAGTTGTAQGESVPPLNLETGVVGGGSTTEQRRFVRTQTLTPDDGATDFGRGSVAISGSTALLGTRWDENVYTTETGPGSVSIYENTASGWVRQTVLPSPTETSDDAFGWSVALDGETAVVGAEWTENAERVYVFERSGDEWVEQAELTPADGSMGLFGDTVAVSGETVLVGCRNDDPNGPLSGSAYVFSRDGTTWSQQAKLVADDGDAEDLFGWGIGISNDTAVVGARGHADGNGDGTGAAYVFERTGDTWTRQAKLVPDDGVPGAEFGEAVAVAGDVILSGARRDQPATSTSDRAGSAYVFERAGGTWSQAAKLTPEREGDLMADTLAVTETTALVESNNSSNAFVYTRNEDGWKRSQTLELDYDETGSVESLALGNGTALLRTRDDSQSAPGGTHVFENRRPEAYETQSGDRTDTPEDSDGISVFERFGVGETLPLAVVGGGLLGSIGVGVYRRYRNQD